VVSSANIACGEHAGSLDVMQKTVSSARDRDVSIGAHPGYPDREGFGRRELSLSLDDIAESFESQIRRMEECCEREGATLRYVKPHGALYNRAARDEELAHRLAECILTINPSLLMLGLFGSFLESVSRADGLGVAREAFIDRGYDSTGALIPRGNDGALIVDPEVAAERAVKLARHEMIRAVDGTPLLIEPDSLCVHGDGARALETVTRARNALERAGITIASFAP